jgi:hypothetical protein
LSAIVLPWSSGEQFSARIPWEEPLVISLRTTDAAVAFRETLP